jgi:hypothetical protein
MIPCLKTLKKIIEEILQGKNIKYHSIEGSGQENSRRHLHYGLITTHHQVITAATNRTNIRASLVPFVRVFHLLFSSTNLALLVPIRISTHELI